MFIGLLTSIVSAPNHTKLVLLSNQKCMTQPSPINLYPNVYSRELRYHRFVVNLDMYVGSCNIQLYMCSKPKRRCNLTCLI